VAASALAANRRRNVESLRPKTASRPPPVFRLPLLLLRLFFRRADLQLGNALFRYTALAHRIDALLRHAVATLAAGGPAFRSGGRRGRRRGGLAFRGGRLVLRLRGFGLLLLRVTLGLLGFAAVGGGCGWYGYQRLRRDL